MVPKVAKWKEEWEDLRESIKEAVEKEKGRKTDLTKVVERADPK